MEGWALRASRGGAFASALGRRRPLSAGAAPEAEAPHTPASPGARGAGARRPGDDDGGGRRAPDEDPLDPSARRAAQLAPPATSLPCALRSESGAATALATKPAETCAQASLEALLPALVRRIAWGGDGRRGSVRIELGAGALAGATVVVHADDGRVRVELSVPSGVDGEGWRQRIAQRLAARGIDLEAFELR